MENNNKKSIFSKKNIIIVACILVLLLLIVYFAFIKSPKDSVMHCTMTMDNYEYANLDMTIDVYYTKKVNRIEGQINFEIIKDELKSKVETIEETLRNYYAKAIKGNSIDINISRMNSNIIVQYNINYDTVKNSDIETFDLLPIENSIERLTIDEFKSKIVNSGGICEE